MGGGGSIGMMNATIKNNRRLLKGRKSLKSIYKNGIYEGDKRKGDFPKTTPKVLETIKKRLQEERRQRFIKILLVFGLVMSSLIVVFLTYI